VGREYSLIRHLCWGILLNHDPERTWIAIVTEYALYLDAAGHPDDRDYLVAAGFIASEKEWMAFEPEWKDALRRHKIGPIFHMTDFEARHRKDPNRGKILEDLTRIICAHTITSFSSNLDIPAYRRVNDTFAMEEHVGTPYAIVARGLARNLIKWADKHLAPDDRLLIFVEEGTKHHGDMEQAFLRDGLPIPQKVPKEHPAVQPGDFLAWEAASDVYCGARRRRSRVNLIVRDTAANHGHFGEPEMINGCLKMGVPRRSQLAPDAKIVYHSAKKRIRKRTIK
jgi:hypothetical protein